MSNRYFVLDTNMDPNGMPQENKDNFTILHDFCSESDEEATAEAREWREGQPQDVQDRTLIVVRWIANVEIII